MTFFQRLRGCPIRQSQTLVEHLSCLGQNLIVSNILPETIYDVGFQTLRSYSNVEEMANDLTKQQIDLARDKNFLQLYQVDTEHHTITFLVVAALPTEQIPRGFIQCVFVSEEEQEEFESVFFKGRGVRLGQQVPIQLKEEEKTISLPPPRRRGRKFQAPASLTPSRTASISRRF